MRLRNSGVPGRGGGGEMTILGAGCLGGGGGSNAGW